MPYARNRKDYAAGAIASHPQGDHCETGQFAVIGFILILIDFIPLAVGLSLSKGNFQSKFIKKAVPIRLSMLIIGIVLIVIPYLKSTLGIELE
jgi:hypothetical protein